MVTTAALFGAAQSQAANILWASESGPNGTTTGIFSGPLDSSITDYGFIKLLQDAGHNVNRFNGPDSQNTLLTTGELEAINTNDLIIIGRTVNSGAFQSPQAAQWNTAITKPLICMSTYLTRTNGLRLGWFAGNEGIDNGAPFRPNPGNGSNPAVDYLFQDQVMDGTNTVATYDEPLDRNISTHLGLPVAGGVVLASVVFPRLDNNIVTNGFLAVGFPAGTVVRMGQDSLAAYRMALGGGSRESATQPAAIPLYTGRENLTPAGERLFLRAIELALNSGVAPTVSEGPAAVVSNPANTTVLEGRSLTLSVVVTGAVPRTVQWQRVDADGVTYTNIPGALSEMTRSSYTLPAVATADNGTKFQVVVANALGMATSAVATITVDEDTVAPVVVSAGSFDGRTISIQFDEPVLTNVALETFYYLVDDGAENVTAITASPDFRSVTLELDAQLGSTAKLEVSVREDQFGNNSTVPVILQITNFGLTGAIIGTLNPPGTNVANNSQTFDVIAGGLDIGSTADNLRFAYVPFTGDFDARVRVRSLVGTFDHLETTAKAILSARESTANNSAAVDVFVTPPAYADNSISARYRPATGVATNSFGPTVKPAGMPNAWMRILRLGNQFSTYHSMDGTTWTAFGTNTLTLGQTLNVGVGAVSHVTNPARTVTATFSDFTVKAISAPVVLTNWAFIGGAFSASFGTVNGSIYTIEYKDTITTPTWTLLESTTGTGLPYSFTNQPVSPTGQRYYRVVGP